MADAWKTTKGKQRGKSNAQRGRGKQPETRERQPATVPSRNPEHQPQPVTTSGPAPSGPAPVTAWPKLAWGLPQAPPVQPQLGPTPKSTPASTPTSAPAQGGPRPAWVVSQDQPALQTAGKGKGNGPPKDQSVQPEATRQSQGGAIPKVQPKQPEARSAPDRSTSVSSDHSVASTSRGPRAPTQGKDVQDTGALGRGSMRGNRTVHDVLRTRPSTAPTKQGKIGTPIRLQANYFKIMKKIEWTLFQYRVDFSPEIGSIRLMQGLLAEHKKKFGGFIFDGTQLFMLNKLSSEKVELMSKHERTGDVYKIKIVKTGSVDMTNEQGLQVLNLILRRAMGGLQMQLVGRNMFDAVAKISIKEYNVELWPGYITSIRQHEHDILLCCEIAHKTMRMQTCYDILRDCQQRDRNYRDSFTRQVLGCVVLTAYNNKTYRIDDISFDMSPGQTFDTKAGSVSFIQYYKQKYNITIRDPKQPMLISRAKKRDLRGGQSELMALVPELCQMTGLTDQMRSDFRMMRAMSDHTRLNPEQRIARLETFNRRLQTSAQSQEVFQNWSTKLDTKMVELNARVLPPEEIFCQNTKNGRLSYGADWANIFKEDGMFSTVYMKNWYLIVPRRCDTDTKTFMTCLKTAARQLKYEIGEHTQIDILDDRPDTYVRAIEMIANKDPSMIVCVVTNNKAHTYSAIKKKCYVDRAIPTQVIVHRTISGSRSLLSIATKILIQMNCKLGGIPWKIRIPLNGLLIIGFDVCHDGNDKSKSFGAMVCQMENDCTKNSRFFSTVNQHQHGEEISNYLPLNVTKALRVFQETYGHLPRKIIFYRDGVGEGQLHYVYEHEVQAVVSKVKQIYASTGQPDVSFAFFVVNKRINTRFFNTRKENPSPGTIVDDVVTMPERTDFYLVSQSVRVGTVSPTAYNIVYDTSGLAIDHLQQLTYKMCHMYFNWTGTTRVPAVCQYAHKLAFLVGQFLHQSPHHLLERSLYFL